MPTTLAMPISALTLMLTMHTPPTLSPHGWPVVRIPRKALPQPQLAVFATIQAAYDDGHRHSKPPATPVNKNIKIGKLRSDYLVSCYLWARNPQANELFIRSIVLDAPWSWMGFQDAELHMQHV